MANPDKLLAEKLLQISAILLQPDNPFVWGSGWNSPIYTDIRRLLSYPDVRNFVKVQLSRTILEQFPDADAIAGVATGAIAIGAITADCLGLPYVYVRKSPKDHGLENLIEGNLKPSSKVVIIEDIISTGGSSHHAMEAIRNSGCDPLGVVGLFNFEFPAAIKRFKNENLPVISLLTYSTMIQVAGEMQYIHPSDIETLQEWRKDPSSWTPAGVSHKNFQL